MTEKPIGLEQLKANTLERKRSNDILVDYEGLHGQLHDLLEVLEMASTMAGTAFLNVAILSLKALRTEHKENIETYRRES